MVVGCFQIFWKLEKLVSSFFWGGEKVPITRNLASFWRRYYVYCAAEDDEMVWKTWTKCIDDDWSPGSVGHNSKPLKHTKKNTFSKGNSLYFRKLQVGEILWFSQIYWLKWFEIGEFPPPKMNPFLGFLGFVGDLWSFSIMGLLYRKSPFGRNIFGWFCFWQPLWPFFESKPAGRVSMLTIRPYFG